MANVIKSQGFFKLQMLCGELVDTEQRMDISTKSQAPQTFQESRTACRKLAGHLTYAGMRNSALRR